MRYIELSHEISDGMPVFPGLERPRITAFLDHEQSRPLYERKAEFYISKLELVGNRRPISTVPSTAIRRPAT